MSMSALQSAIQQMASKNVAYIIERITSDPVFRVIFPLDDASGNARALNPAVALGRDIVVGGDFTSAPDWACGTGHTVTGGQLVLTAAGNASTTYQDLPITAGVTYQLTYTVAGYTAGDVWVFVGNSSTPAVVDHAIGTYTSDVVCAGAVLRLTLMAIGASTTITLDNVELRAKTITANSLTAGTVTGSSYGQTAGPKHLAGYSFDGGDNVAVYSNRLNDLLDPDLVTIGLFVQAASSVWMDATPRWLLDLRAGAAEDIDQVKVKTDGYGGVIVYVYRGGKMQTCRVSVSTANLWLLEIAIDATSDEWYVLVNGAQYGAKRTALGAWKYNFVDTTCVIGNWLSYAGTGHSGFLSSFFTIQQARSQADGVGDAASGGASGPVGQVTGSTANYVLCDGDSLTAGNQIGVTTPYPTALLAMLSNYEIWNSGVGSERADTLLASFAATVTPLYEAARTKNIYVLCTGINDVTQDQDAASTYADIWTICDNAQALGFDVIICNLTPINGLSAPRDAVRAAINAEIAANWALHADAFVDFAGDARLSNPANAVYYSDGTHNTDAGYAVRAELVKAAIVAL